ncbi:hypothetical protein FB562_0728 [Homoserinimonas aerilata]|uniref:Uncharacterized protein n=1 Tax=Homoserinimonas aerilata TaxID=1162970 RepID=A0A542YHV8_9MICO|nr:hypothetical protein [Homoserinimonas aerilata]TQL47662.1 hypothetical protein FB562_0728 [Homoserinimonas aerilata]
MSSRKALTCLPLLLALSLLGCTAAPGLGASGPAGSSGSGAESGEAPALGEGVDFEDLPECEGFILDEDEDVAGSIVASCVIATAVAHNHGKMTVETDDGNGLTIFRYEPYAARVVTLDDNRLFISGDEMWFQDQIGWVRAEKDSSNPRAMMAYTITSAFRAFNDPRVAVAMLETATSWKIIDEEEIDRPDGNSKNAWRLDAEPFDFMGVHISALSLWIDNSYTTLQQEAVSSALGISTVTLNRYYDWGVEEEFIAPVG